MPAGGVAVVTADGGLRYTVSSVGGPSHSAMWSPTGRETVSGTLSVLSAVRRSLRTDTPSRRHPGDRGALDDVLSARERLSGRGRDELGRRAGTRRSDQLVRPDRRDRHTDRQRDHHATDGGCAAFIPVGLTSLASGRRRRRPERYASTWLRRARRLLRSRCRMSPCFAANRPPWSTCSRMTIPFGERCWPLRAPAWSTTRTPGRRSGQSMVARSGTRDSSSGLDANRELRRNRWHAERRDRSGHGDAATGTRPDIPVTRDDSTIVRAGDIVSVPVLDNDADPNGDPLGLFRMSGTIPFLRDNSPLPVPTEAGRYVIGHRIRRGRRGAIPAPARLASQQTVTVTYGARDPSGSDAAGGSARHDQSGRAGGERQSSDPPQIEARVVAGDPGTHSHSHIGDRSGRRSVTVTGIGAAPLLGRVTTIGLSSLTYLAYPSSAGADPTAYGTDVPRTW